MPSLHSFAIVALDTLPFAHIGGREPEQYLNGTRYIQKH
jgi:hypothetical protein